jgi:hypothetical protein
MQEKSKGILAYASNTATVDYVGIAKQTLALASSQLNIPYTLITPDTPSNWQNFRKDIDTNQAVPWNNFDRYRCYEHSPYDQTLVIDVDYLVTTKRLLSVFCSGQNLLLCHKNNCLYEPTPARQQLQPVWATVFYFAKSVQAEMFFQLVGKIQRNWEYYRTFFGLQQSQFRNDYAFAMAELISSGYKLTKHTALPWHITTVDKTPEEIDVNNNWIVVRDSAGALILPRQDLHVMSKAWLQTSKLQNFISKALA